MYYVGTTAHVGDDLYCFICVVGVVADGIAVLDVFELGYHAETLRTVLPVVALLLHGLPKMRFTEHDSPRLT